MLKKLGIIVITCGLLNACSTTKYQSADQAARCKELKKRMVFNNPFNSAVNTQVMSRQQFSNQALERAYRDEGC